jgi:hypothetical protein
VDIEEEFVEGLGRDGVGVVELAFGLLDDDQELAAELVLVDLRVEEGVGLDLEPGLEGGGGEDGIVGGVVVDRPRVQESAGAPGGTGDLPRPQPLGPLEVHVFEDMADPHQPVGLVEVPGADMGHDGDDGCRMVLAHEDGEPVGEASFVGGQAIQIAIVIHGGCGTGWQ